MAFAAALHLSIAAFLAGAPVLARAGSDHEVPALPVMTAADEELAAQLEPGERACGVWRSGLGKGRAAVLAVFCSDAGGLTVAGAARWRLYVATAERAPKRLARVLLGSHDDARCGARGSLRARSDVVPGEPVLEVAWGCRSAGEGIFPTVELWRWSAQKLERVFRMPSSMAASPDGPEWRVTWRPAQAGGAPAVEVTWRYSSASGGELQWRGEQRLVYRLGRAGFRPPPGAFLQALASASAFVPASSGRAYAPPRAVDGRAETAWCAEPEKSASLWVRLVEPTRLLGVRLLPGDARSPRAFRDRAAVARIRIDAGGGEAKPVSFEASLADRMRPQSVVMPEEAGAIEWIRVTVLEVRPGRKRPEACIAEIEVVPR